MRYIPHENDGLVHMFITDDKSELLNPMGTVEKNPNVDSAAGLLIRFPNIRPHPLHYPPLDKVFIPKGFILYWCCVQPINLFYFQISDLEKNGDAPVATKEEVRFCSFFFVFDKKEERLL